MGIVADILSRVMGYRNGEGADHGRHVEQITQRLLQRMLERTDKYGLTLRTAGGPPPRLCSTTSERWACRMPCCESPVP